MQMYVKLVDDLCLNQEMAVFPGRRLMRNRVTPRFLYQVKDKIWSNVLRT
jgi:hypothetical protein